MTSETCSPVQRPSFFSLVLTGAGGPLGSTTALVDLHTKFSSTGPPHGTRFFHFHLHFHQQVPASEVHTLPKCVYDPPPMGNPGCAPEIYSILIY